MSDQQVPTTANDILGRATPDQVRWVVARLSSKTDHEAARIAGVHPSTVSKWENKGDLDRAVNLLLQEPITAARSILERAAVDAAQVLVDSLTMKGRQLVAANSVLDRVGVTGTNHIDVTSGGKALKGYVNVSPDDWPAGTDKTDPEP